MRVRTAVLSLAVPTLLLVASTAAAHVTYPTDDGRYLMTLGNLGEPVYTYQKTGLDLIIRENTTERAEVAGVNDTLDAVLVAPGGEELAMALKAQHGAVGRYTFEQGYTLTQPGMYKVRLTGTIGETPVTGEFLMPHDITPQSEIMFPDKGLPTLQDLAEENERLGARLGALERELATLRAMSQDDERATTEAETPTDAPLPAGMLLVLAGAGAALVASRARRR